MLEIFESDGGGLNYAEILDDDESSEPMVPEVAPTVPKSILDVGLGRKLDDMRVKIRWEDTCEPLDLIKVSRTARRRLNP